MKKEISADSLAHTKWDCKYHIVFAPKYRRKVFFENKRLEIREILRTLCKWERSRCNRGRNLSRPYTHAGKYSAEDKCFGIYGVLKGEKQFDDISEMGESEVRIPKP